MQDFSRTVEYKKTYLKEVIFRVDYASSVDIFSEDMPQGVIEYLDNISNRRDLKYVKVEEVYFGADNAGIVKKVDQFKEWHFGTEDFDFSISKNYLILSITRFHGFKFHSNHFMSLWKKIIEATGHISLRRVGIRYINYIPIPDSSKDWRNYINPLVVPTLIHHPANLEPIRMLNSVEYRNEDSILRFQYGFPNKDYPSRSNNDLFVLDYDEYCDITFESTILESLINSFHNHIFELFQQTILQPLKDLMNAE